MTPIRYLAIVMGFAIGGAITLFIANLYVVGSDFTRRITWEDHARMQDKIYVVVRKLYREVSADWWAALRALVYGGVFGGGVAAVLTLVVVGAIEVFG